MALAPRVGALHLVERDRCGVAEPRAILSRSSSTPSLRSMLNVRARCSKPSPLAFCECFWRRHPGNPPVLEGKIFGIGFSVAPIGEQADNLEALRRAAAYQNGHGHVLTKVLGVADSEILACAGSLVRCTASGDGRDPPPSAARGNYLCCARWMARADVMAITKWSILDASFASPARTHRRSTADHPAREARWSIDLQ